MSLQFLTIFYLLFASILSIGWSFTCRRISNDESLSNTNSPPPLPKSNLELSLDPILSVVNWGIDHLQPRTDLFVSTIPNISVAYSEITSNPTGPTSLRLAAYYTGYVVISVFLLFVAVIWPIIGIFFCLCRCCKNCCYGPRGDIYSANRNKNTCRRCGCGFLFFILFLCVMGACLGCFISAVIFRFNATSTNSIQAAAEATSSAYNGKGGDNADSYLITERFGAAAVNVIKSIRQLGHAYSSILRRHVNELTDSMMNGVKDLVRRLSIYIDNDWLGGANATLDETKILQQNITSLVKDLNYLLEKHNEAKNIIDTCVFTAQSLKSDILSACSETISRECSRELTQNMLIFTFPSQLKKIFDSLPRLDESRIRSLEQQRVGEKAEKMISAYSSDLERIQAEAYRIANGSSVRKSVYDTLNSSLGTAANILKSRTDNFARIATEKINAIICDGQTDKKAEMNGDANQKSRSYIAMLEHPGLDYFFYALMGIASIIGLIVLFIGFSMLACCAGRSYFKRSSCFAMTAVGITFLFSTVLAASCLVLFLSTSMTHSEICRPVQRKDAQMFKVVDDFITDALSNGDFDTEGEWPPELIFASSSKMTNYEAWQFSFGSTLASCSKNASLIASLQLRLPQSRLADKIIQSVRSELQQATNDAVMRIESRLEHVGQPSGELQQVLIDLSALRIEEWQLPQYPSQEEIIQQNSAASLSRLSFLISKEIGSESKLIEDIKIFNTNCQGHLIGDLIPWLLRATSSIEARSKAVGVMSRNITSKVEDIVKKVFSSSDQFRTVLEGASHDLSNYLEVAARKKLADFENILAKDEAGRCNEAADKVLAASEVICRPIGILSVFALLLLGVVLITLPLIWCVGAPFAQTLRWPSNPIIPGINPNHMHQAPGFEGLPLLDLLPRYQKIG